jgi:undecaprenyl phosphate N,N'-diacetylbacillosamine 1-phosphate transferase
VRGYRYLKRPIDASVALLALVLLAPLLAVIAIAIRMDSAGPALYRQRRVGRWGHPFVMLKFRSMVQGAPDLRNPDGSTFNARHDARVTRLGRFLRAWSLDELPQLWNILLGDMSLIGGRPDLPDAVQTYEGNQGDRLLVRPGLTSLAITGGRNNVPVARRRDLDAWYARNVSFRLDMRIVLYTIRIVVRREGVINDISKTVEALPRESPDQRSSS